MKVRIDNWIHGTIIGIGVPTLTKRNDEDLIRVKLTAGGWTAEAWSCFALVLILAARRIPWTNRSNRTGGSPMARVWRVGRNPLLFGHGLLMMSLGVALCFLGSIMSDPAFLELGYDTAIALTVLGLLVPGVFVWIFPQRIGRRRQMIVNVVVGSSFIGSWLILRLLQSGPTDLLILVLLAGLHGVFWSIWYMRLAFTFHEKARKAQLLSVLAAATSIPGIVLALQSQISKLIAVTEVAWYALFIGMQNLMTFMYLCREGRAEADSEAGRVLHLLPMAKPSRVPLTARSVNRGESIDEGLRVSAD